MTVTLSPADLRAAVGVPAGSPTLEVDGVRLAYDRQGAGPPVVCLSAIQHGARDFDAFAERVRDRFEVIRLDWPGHGRSGQDREPASAARYGALLAGVLRALDLDAPILLGCSIGGAAAIHAAAASRDEGRPVRALALCDAGGLVAADPSVSRACAAMAGVFAAGERGAAWFDLAFSAYYRWLVLPQPAAAAQRRRIVAAGRATAGVARQAWESFGRPQADIRAVLAGLQVPVWAAWAAQERIVPLVRCRAALETAGAEISSFRGGHAAFLEQPDAFAEGFADFVRRRAPPASAVSPPAPRAVA
ncbi:alpha/beta fold hydrolase [Caulobacter sp. KR2-114]|uniref:alpha/beta fold hydrolase n=1 Tax=Caulobacter sp. KR2-114 TaxID=3400912 RepID=UPI003C0A420C